MQTIFNYLEQAEQTASALSANIKYESVNAFAVLRIKPEYPMFVIAPVLDGVYTKYGNESEFISVFQTGKKYE